MNIRTIADDLKEQYSTGGENLIEQPDFLIHPPLDVLSTEQMTEYLHYRRKQREELSKTFKLLYFYAKGLEGK
jgi:hypothetical protein